MNDPIRNPVGPVEKELLTEDGEPIMAPLHDHPDHYFHEVTVDRADFPGGEVGSRVQLFRPKAPKRNARRENHG